MKQGAALLCWLILFFSAQVCHAQPDTAREIISLLQEREELLDQLGQPQSALVRASLNARLDRVERGLAKLGFKLPPRPDLMASELSQSTLPPVLERPRRPPKQPPPELLPYDPSLDDRREVEMRLLSRPAPGRSPLRIEFGVLPVYRGNYFEAVNGAPRRAVLTTTVSGRLELDLFRAESSYVTSEFRLRRNMVRDLEDADSYLLDARIAFGFGANRLDFVYFLTPRRLAFVTPQEKVFNSVQGGRLEYVVSMTKAIRFQAATELGREIYSAFKERDSTRYRGRGDLQFRLHPAFAPGVGVEAERVRAVSDNFDYDFIGPVVLFSSHLANFIWLGGRYRFGSRDYTTVDPAAVNFGRRDRRSDWRAYAAVRVSKYLWLSFYGSYVDNRSTRLSRSFIDHELGLGLFTRLP